MKYLISTILTATALIAQTDADLENQEGEEDGWVVDYVTETSINASVYGEVTYGDKLHASFVKDNCDEAKLFTYVYTYSENPNILQLEDKFVSAKFMDDDVTVKVMHVFPFMLGHRAAIDIGWVKKVDLKQNLQKENSIYMEYVDSDEINISEYFDITENSWSNKNLNEILDKASKLCEEL